ncbi:MAG: hypothetical protein MMC23_005677 [Stictis urceolatum]|nr:hypothetical protein [Stictis urceolata]
MTALTPPPDLSTLTISSASAPEVQGNHTVTTAPPATKMSAPTSPPPASPRPPPSLLSLPFELRLEVYKHYSPSVTIPIHHTASTHSTSAPVLTTKSATPPASPLQSTAMSSSIPPSSTSTSPPPCPTLLLTNKQINTELTPALYSARNLLLPIPLSTTYALSSFAQVSPPALLRYLGSVRLLGEWRIRSRTGILRPENLVGMVLAGVQRYLVGVRRVEIEFGGIGWVDWERPLGRALGGWERVREVRVEIGREFEGELWSRLDTWEEGVNRERNGRRLRRIEVDFVWEGEDENWATSGLSGKEDDVSSLERGTLSEKTTMGI